MGFEDSYQFLTDKDKRGSYANKTFLEFWGFEHAIGNPESYTVRRNDGYSAKFISDNEIKIEKRTYSKEVTNYHDEFHRKHKPTQKEKKLEDRFVALMKEKKEEQEKNYFWLEQSPHFATSVKGYYGSCFFDLWVRVIVIGFIINAIGGILMTIVFGAISLLGAFLLQLGVVLFSGIIIGLIRIIRRYSVLGTEKKQKIREKYLKSLTVGIPEADQILREYAILRGYDKI